MTTTAADTAPGTFDVPDDAAGVLAAARERRAVADRAEADLLALAVQWAVIHPAETLDDAEGYATRVHIAGVDEEPMPLAGPPERRSPGHAGASLGSARTGRTPT